MAYIGSAISIRSRWTDHRKLLRGHRHDNIHLQRAWDRDGEAAFTFSVLEHVTDPALLIEREQYWLDRTPNKYNLCPTAGNCLGRVVSLQGRQNISAGRAGISPMRTEEHEAKLLEAQQRYREEHPDEALAQWQAAVDASAAKRRGVPLSVEHRAKVGAALNGKKRPPRSPEHIAKLREAAQRRAQDPDYRRRVSESMKAKGIAPSMEARQMGANARKKPPAD